MIFLGADHRGFKYKEALKRALTARGVLFEDCGNMALVPDDDFPEFALAVAGKVSQAPNEHLGIVICGSGSGVAMAANKVRGARAAVAWNLITAQLAREHDFANVLAIAADHVDITTAEAMVFKYLESQPLVNVERYARRINEISCLEPKC